MREPLLDVTLPSKVATLDAWRRSADPDAEKVVIVPQVFDSFICQAGIVLICGTLAKSSGVRLITVEGADGSVEADSERRGITALIQETSNDVSAGVVSLLGGPWGPYVRARGVDELNLKTESESVQVLLVAARARVYESFEIVRLLLTAARHRWYSSELAAVRESMILVDVGAGITFDAQLALIDAAAAATGVDVDAFPVLSSLRADHDLMAALDQERARTERGMFFTRIGERLDSWVRPAGHGEVHIDLEAVQPLFEYWMESIGYSEKEMREMVNQRGLELMLVDCRNWYWSWFARSRIPELVEGERWEPRFHEELMRLALRAGVPFFDLEHYRRAVALSRIRHDDAGRLRRLSREMTTLCRTLANHAAAANGKQLFEVEERIDSIYRAVTLAISPERLAVSDLTPGAFTRAVQDLISLAVGADGDAALAAAKRIEVLLKWARRFFECAVGRTYHMAKRTLQLMRENGEDRAVMVVGGAHPQGVERALEEQPGVSWSVVRPWLEDNYGRHAPGGHH